MTIYSDPEAKRAAEMLRAGSTDGRVGSTAAPTTDDRLDALANLLRLHLNVQQRLNDDIVTLMKERFDVVRVLATLQSIERRLSAIEAHRTDTPQPFKVTGSWDKPVTPWVLLAEGAGGIAGGSVTVGKGGGNGSFRCADCGVSEGSLHLESCKQLRYRGES